MYAWYWKTTGYIRVVCHSDPDSGNCNHHDHARQHAIISIEIDRNNAEMNEILKKLGIGRGTAYSD